MAKDQHQRPTRNIRVFWLAPKPAEAIPHVNCPVILNDCEENKKLLRKQPECIVRKWSWIVVDELDTSGIYPGFAYITEYLSRKARLFCNGIISTVDKFYTCRWLNLLNTQPKSLPATSIKPKCPCFVCKNEAHGLTRCHSFAAKSIKD